MSSDFFMFEECFYHQNSTIFNSDETQLLTESDPLSDSSIDSILQEISQEQNMTNSQSLEQLPQTLLENSPPSHELESLSLYQQTQFSNLSNSSDFSGGYVNYPVSAIKTEQAPYFLGSQSYGEVEDSAMIKLLHRSLSYGSHSYEEEKPWILLQPRVFDALFESSGFENGFSNAHMRRVCSTGDLPVMNNNEASAQGESSASTCMEEGSFKVGKYSAEERKERIDRYKAKRTQRNFNKTIKYACRKTLADSRPRVRGRFARNDEAGEMPKSTPCLNKYEDEDDILLYSWHEDEDVGRAGVGGSAGGCGDGGGRGRRGQYLNYQFGGSSEIHHYLGY